MLLFLSNVEEFVMRVIGKYGVHGGLKILTIINVTVKMVTTIILMMVDQMSQYLVGVDMLKE
jgi:hypothetical protein